MKANAWVLIVLSFLGFASAAQADFVSEIAPMLGRKGQVRMILNGELRYPTTGCQLRLVPDFRRLDFSFQEPLPVDGSFTYGDESSLERRVEEGRVTYLTPKSDPVDTHLCGAFVSTRGMQHQLTIAEDDVELRITYRCGLNPKRKTFVLSCKLN